VLSLAYFRRVHQPIHHILQLVAKGESETLDFKKTISSAAKIAKTLSAFSNHKGGRLLVGVNDNKTISGVRSEDEKYMLDMAAGFYCKPEVQLHITEWEIGGKTIIEAEVPEAKEKPVYAKDEDGKWWVHIRVKDQSLLASKIVVDVLKREQKKEGTLIIYTKHEESLLQYLSTNHRITLKELCKLLNISRWRAQKMLVNLVSTGIIRNHTTEKTEFFTLS
jgi:predicted HTH transcriptional regulator